MRLLLIGRFKRKKLNELDIGEIQMLVAEEFHKVKKLNLNFKTTKEKREESIYSASDWIYRWWYSSPIVVNQLSQTSSNGLSGILVNYGLVKSTKTACGSGFKNIPGQMLTLTKEGVRLIESRRDTLIKYDVNPYRIRQDQLRHNHIAQSLTMNKMSSGKIIKFETEKEFGKLSSFEIKQPDVIWTLKNQLRVGVEVELTGKWDRALDHQISSCINALRKNDYGISELDYILFYSDSPGIITRYKKAYEAGKTYATWGKDNQGRWLKEDQMVLPSWITGKLIFILLKENLYAN